MVKACSVCGESKPIDQFYRRKDSGYIEARCKPCRKEQTKRWRRSNPAKSKAATVAWKAANPERIKAYRDKDSMRRSRDAVQMRRALRERKAGRPKPERCEVCGVQALRIVWDHKHSTGEFRGWLCHGCNVAIGHARENPVVLRLLADYVERGGPRG